MEMVEISVQELIRLENQLCERLRKLEDEPPDQAKEEKETLTQIVLQIRNWIRTAKVC